MNNDPTPPTVVVPPERRCPRCSGVLGGFGPEGLCGACLFASGLATDDPAAELDSLASGPRRFGDYELLAEIARGGMGVVFRARQVSLNRIVAVKMILRGEFAGVAELARFRAEAETAARLQHPHIVAIHEVGECEGQPFFCMDFVEGRSLAQLAGNTPLLAARAAGYLKTIAEAVHYAHQRGVLHRDLKPSNVLVDMHDQPHVTDFGLAKRLNNSEPGTPNPELTLTGQVLGSPNFMPPEQAAGRSDAIGPASDVYSLGAMLYHLLTGRPPFVAESVTATLRLVAESEPVSPRLLNGSVPRDLETICLKCLHKEPQRRYGSAQELVDELNRFLKDEPIHARPVSQAEKIWRWSRRNPALARSLSVAATALLIVAVGSPIAAFRINHARQQAEADKKKAETEAAKSQQVARFLRDMMAEVAPSKALGRDDAMLRDILDKTAQRISRELTNQPEVEIELRSTMSHAYHELGLYPAMETMARASLELARSRLGEENPYFPAALAELGDALHHLSRDAESESFLREALARYRRLRDGTQPMRVHYALEHLALSVEGQGKFAEAEALHREALAVAEGLTGIQRLNIAQSLHNLASLLAKQDRFDQAESALRRALEIKTALLDPRDPSVVGSRGLLGDVLTRRGRLDEAETLLRDVLATRRQLHKSAHPDLAGAIEAVAFVLKDRGTWTEAEARFREAIAIREELKGAEADEALSNTLDALATVLQSEGKLSEAERQFHRALAMRRKLFVEPHLAIAQCLNNLASVVHEQKRFPEAEGFYHEGLEQKRAIFTNDHRSLALSLDNLGRLLLDAEKFADAKIVLREGLGMRRRLFGTNNLDVTDSAYCLASVLMELDELPEAEALFREALATRRTLLGNTNRVVASTLHDLAATLQGLGRFVEAETLGREALSIYQQVFPDAPGRWKLTIVNLVTVLMHQRKADDAGLLLAGMPAPVVEQALRDVVVRLRRPPAPDPQTEAAVLFLLSDALVRQSRFSNAEPVLRQCVAMFEKSQPRLTPAFKAQSLLGVALLGQQRYPEAERFLTGAFEGLAAREAVRPAASRAKLLQETAGRLVQLYEAWGKPVEAENWRRKASR